MNVEQALFEALTTGSPLPTDAGDRVYAVLMPQDVVLPAVSFQRISNNPIVSLDGASGLDQVRIQVDCWAETYAAVKTLSAQVRSVMEGINALPVMDLDGYEEVKHVYRLTMDFSMWQK